MEIERSQPPRKRRRPPKSCEQCRKRKVRCDQNLPCNQCIRMKINNCTYDPQTILKRQSQSRKAATTVNNGAPPTPASTISSLPYSRDNASTATSHAESPLAIHTSASADVHYSVERQNEALEIRPLHIAQSSDLPTTDLHGTITKTRLLGRSHWINIIRIFPFVKVFQDKLEAGEELDLKAILDRCKSLGRSIKSQTYSQLKAHTDVRDHIPTRDLADSLVENYFRAFESCYRILHIPSFRREYEQYWQAPETASSAFVIKLLLVMAIGTCLSDERSTHYLHILALQWINTAQIWLSSPFTEKSKLCLSAIQAHCLLIIARQMNAVSPDLVWISAGSLVRMAMLCGLHRDPSQFPRLSPVQAEIRRRLWATVMEICLQASMDAGGSPMVLSEMYDCRPPSNLDDVDLDQITGVAVRPKSNTVYTQSSIQIALMETMPLRCQVAKLLNDFRSDASFAETLQIDGELTESLNHLSSRLKSAGAQISTRNTGFKMYELITYRFLCSLHQEFAIKAMKNPSFYFSRKVCVDTSLHLSSILSSNYAPRASSEPLSASDYDFKQLMEYASGPPRNSISNAGLLLCMEVAAQLQQSPSAAVTTSSDQFVRREVFRIFDGFMEWNLNRIKKGETNVKGYVFVATKVAYLKALMNGTSGIDAAFQAGRESLELCAGILEQRMDELKEAITPKPPVLLDDQLDENLNVTFGDFGWDDWDPMSDLGSTGFWFPEPQP